MVDKQLKNSRGLNNHHLLSCNKSTEGGASIVVLSIKVKIVSFWSLVAKILK